MSQDHLATAAVSVNATPQKVWDALTQPQLIKQYLFGTEVSTDWRVGSPITYSGVWEGKSYQDKGRILEVLPGRRLVSTYWSGMSGKPDLPENYQTVRYELSPEGSGTRLTVTQDNNASQADADHSAQNWQMVLDGLKKLVEA